MIAMNSISSWTATVQTDVAQSEKILERTVSNFLFSVCISGDSAWIIVNWPQGGRMAFRAAFALNSHFKLDNLVEEEDVVLLQLSTEIGKYELQLQFPNSEHTAFRYTTTFHPDFPVLIPFWPRDIVPLTGGKVENTFGKIHAAQVGTRSGILFSSYTKPKTGSFLYFQDLTNLSPYCDATETSLAETVGGQWPEIGFKLPVTKDVPMPAEKFVVSDAYVLLSEELPEEDVAVATQYLNLLAEVYLLIPKPETNYNDWQDISQKALADLTSNKGCWTHADGHSYLNAYLCDYATPAEIMVQLAVMYAVKEYSDWSGEKHQLVKNIRNGLESFYDPKLETISRWLPSKRDELDHAEEQKSPLTMDSWYLHHPLLNLSKLALDGDAVAETLLTKSVAYAIKVAQHFAYQWPVFYKMDTLEVLKAETEPGKGGEKDVAGGYALVMLNVWKLTGDEKYFKEAVKALKKLSDNGLEIFYQANTTAFSALALLRLYKETDDVNYLNTSYLCIAGIMKNVQLWECDYGNAKNFTNFFGVFPLNNAPYKAAYEEMEVYAALNDYLLEAVAINAPILASLEVLIPEFVKYSINRLCCYYPTLLPANILSDEVKTGEIDPNLWIPVEDIYDGWEQHGQVGQEVYGAGVGFGVIPRQYHKVKGERFLVYCDYPVQNFRTLSNHKTVSFRILGNPKLKCRIRIISAVKLKHSDFTVTAGSGKNEMVYDPTVINSNSVEFLISAGEAIKIKWK